MGIRDREKELDPAAARELDVEGVRYRPSPDLDESQRQRQAGEEIGQPGPGAPGERSADAFKRATTVRPGRVDGDGGR